jgi:hypothetical protein
MLECLKYFGSTISSKARKLCILKEQTDGLLPEGSAPSLDNS